MDIKKQILHALGLSAEVVNLEYQNKLEDGTIIVSTAEKLEAGVDISVLTEDGSTMPLAIGEYITADGETISVTEEGIVAEVSAAETTEEETEEVEAKKEDDKKKYEEAPAEEVVEEVIDEVGGAVAEVAAAIDDATGEEVTPEVAEQAAEIAVAIIEEKVEEVAMAKHIRVILEATKKELTSLKSQLKKTEDKVKELSESPATNGIELNKFSNNRSGGVQELSPAEYHKLDAKGRYWYNLSLRKNK